MRRKIRRKVEFATYLLKSKIYWSRHPEEFVGSKDWFIEMELKYGGKVYATTRLSALDPRHSNYDSTIGGDRMLQHGYAKFYSEYLKPLYSKNRNSELTICEFGILNGTGLAIWCDLFPNSRCLGLDIDLSNTQQNMDQLKSSGAFKCNLPELYEYDQFAENSQFLGQILKGDKVDLCIDDGCHIDEAIITTLSSVLPHLNDNFIYIIEDNGTVHEKIREHYPELNVQFFKRLGGALTILSAK